MLLIIAPHVDLIAGNRLTSDCQSNYLLGIGRVIQGIRIRDVTLSYFSSAKIWYWPENPRKKKKALKRNSPKGLDFIGASKRNRTAGLRFTSRFNPIFEIVKDGKSR